jgi:hypothetical protein
MYGRGTEMPYMCYTILILFFFPFYSSSFLPFFIFFLEIFFLQFLLFPHVFIGDIK